MHIKSLKIFCDVVHQRSFSRAADENGVSQSNASQVVHQLEERLGVQLIDRSTRPFGITPEGERYYEGCRGIVRRYFDLERDVQSLHEAVSKRLTVASIYSVGLAHMSRYLREFLAHHPQADVRLEYLHPQRVCEAVENTEADLGLVSYPEESRTLAAITWRTEPMVVVCYPEHSFATRESVPLEALQDEPFVALQQGLRFRDEIDRALALQEVNVSVSLEFDNIETIKRAIEIGAGVSILPEPTVVREVATGTLRVVALAGSQLARPLGIIHRRDEELSDTSRLFVELLQSHAHDEEFVSTNGSPSRRNVKETFASLRS